MKCNKCEREIISSGEDKNEFCIGCEWEKEAEETEINLESVRKFMEKYRFSAFNFVEGECAKIEFQKGEYDKKYGMVTYQIRGNKVMRKRK